MCRDDRLPHWPASDLGYTNASVLGAGGGVWIYPNEGGKNYTWRIKWPANITQELVSFANTEGSITNSYLKLVSLLLQEAVFGSISASHAWETPTLGSDNNSIVAWTFRKASNINPVVADLLSTHSSHNKLHKITLSVFYHPGPLNNMADDASRRFYPRR